MHSCMVNGIRLATVDQGRGPPVLLIHGFPLDHSMWDGQIETISSRYRVLAPDLRGFGQSGVTDASVSMEQHADDLAALMDALGIADPIVLCGLSMGGYIAFEFWRKYSPRLRALVLCDTRSCARYSASCRRPPKNGRPSASRRHDPAPRDAPQAVGPGDCKESAGDRRIVASSHSPQRSERTGRSPARDGPASRCQAAPKRHCLPRSGARRRVRRHLARRRDAIDGCPNVSLPICLHSRSGPLGSPRKPDRNERRTA